jgi:uncharacterized protein YbcI
LTDPQTQPQNSATSVLSAISNAMVALHKEHFGRGPTRARTDFAGPDTLVCVLEDVLLPAERKLVALSQQDRVRDSRGSFQAATAEEFVSVVEDIVDRKVRALRERHRSRQQRRVRELPLRAA